MTMAVNPPAFEQFTLHETNPHYENEFGIRFLRCCHGARVSRTEMCWPEAFNYRILYETGIGHEAYCSYRQLRINGVTLSACRYHGLFKYGKWWWRIILSRSVHGTSKNGGKNRVIEETVREIGALEDLIAVSGEMQRRKMITINYKLRGMAGS